jgi:hypothetical protein
MKVFVVTYDTVYAYSDGTKYTGIEGVYSSRERAEQEILSRVVTSAYDDSTFDIEEHEVK